MTQIQKTDIILFADSGQQAKTYPTNILKNFLHFLNYVGAKRPYRFAHIPSEGTLFQKLTLKNNILLDSISQGFEPSKDRAYENRISELEEKNPHLKKLLENIGQLNQLPGDVSAEKRKALSLIKGLLQQSDYLFLENPEKHLTTTNLELFILAMEHNSMNTGQVIIISSPFSHVWKDICSKIVTRDEENRFHLDTVLTDIETGKGQSPKRKRVNLEPVQTQYLEHTEERKKGA